MALAARRRQQLQALGIQPWRLRQAPARREAAEAGNCIVLVPAGCDTRIRDLLARALQAAGGALARSGCISVDSASMPLPPATAYLLLDASLEAGLSGQHPQAARHVLASPASLLSAAGKRHLWQLLRQLRMRPAMLGSH